MYIFENINDVSLGNNGSVLAIGNFDGVHYGHQSLLIKGEEISNKTSLPFIVLTFMPHPVEILKPQHLLKLILPYEDKIRELKKYNIDYLIIQKFDKDFSLTKAETFIEDFLIKKLKIKYIVLGQNFKFGSNNGNMELLRYYSRKLDFEVLSMDLLYGPDQQVISSSKIKQELAKGNISQANVMLGREYLVTAYVVKSINNICFFLFSQRLALRSGRYEVVLNNLTMNQQIETIFFYDGLKNGESKILNNILMENSKVEITFKNYIGD